jgi:hypothetical protein
MKMRILKGLKSWRSVLGATTIAFPFVATLVGGFHAMTVEGNNQEKSLPNVVLVHAPGLMDPVGAASSSASRGKVIT